MWQRPWKTRDRALSPVRRSSRSTASPCPEAAQAVGPIPPDGKVRLSFRTSLSAPGSHLLTVRLLGGDLLPGDDASDFPIEVETALSVLLVNGEPGAVPFSGETDFLRTALAPRGDDMPQVRVRVVSPGALSTQSLMRQRVVVLANVERLAPEQMVALSGFIESGGGLLFAPGDRTDPISFNEVGWMAARLAGVKGSLEERKPVAHPSPRTFIRPIMSMFSQGDSAPLAEADFFAYRVLAPAAGAVTAAQLDTGEPWVVCRASGRGHVVVLSTAVDAEAGTLPVNPDFVPLAHEWILYLAGGSASSMVRPGEPLLFTLNPRLLRDRTELPIQTPGGTTVRRDREGAEQ